MVKNFEFKGGYGVFKLRPQSGNFKMENNLQPCPVMEESMDKARGNNKNQCYTKNC